MKDDKSGKFPCTWNSPIKRIPDDEFEELLAKQGGYHIQLNPKPLFKQLAETPTCKCGSRQFVKVSKPGEKEKYKCKHCGLILN